MNRELVALLDPDVIRQAVIVYDAFESVSNDNRRQIINGLMVVFAPMGTDADSEIERLLLQHSVPRRVIVVSSDHRLHKAAARRKARCVDSEDFWASLEVEPEPASSTVAAPEKDETSKTAKAPDHVVDELQKFAEDAQRIEEPGDQNLPGTAVFDEEYLRDLNEKNFG